jgi:histidinol-phosphatase
MADTLDLLHAVDVAQRAVAAGGAAALGYWRRGLSATPKADGSPVTQADRAAEAAILDVLRWHFPRHAILAEESGAHGPNTTDHPTWIVDPLDGTYAFLRGSHVWGPLVALSIHGEVVVGAMALPALKEAYWAGQGLGAWCNDARLQVSAVADWSEAALALGSVRPLLAGPHAAGVAQLMRTAHRTYAPGDLGGAALVLGGQADVWLESGVDVWDLAPFRILVTEAGGRFTDLTGGKDLGAGGAVVSNGHLHDHVLAQLIATEA